jgi:hypothetical protein
MTPDIDTLLREADPAALVPAPEAHGATADAILARVLTRPSRRLPVVAALVALVVLAGGVAFALIINDQVDSGRDVMCYSAPSVGSLSLVQSADDVIDASVCEGLWVAGVLESPSVRLGEVPSLEACVLPSRTLAVFPAADPAICDELALDAFEEPIDVRRSMAQQVKRLFDPGRCTPYDAGLTQIGAFISGFGEPGWTVKKVSSPSAERPCLSLFVIEADRSLEVRAVPDLAVD